MLFMLETTEKNTEKLGYRNISLLSCMTLSLENLHSTMNKKHERKTVMTCASSFASSVQESVKQLVE